MATSWLPFCCYVDSKLTRIDADEEEVEEGNKKVSSIVDNYVSSSGSLSRFITLCAGQWDGWSGLPFKDPARCYFTVYHRDTPLLSVRIYEMALCGCPVHLSNRLYIPTRWQGECCAKENIFMVRGKRNSRNCPPRVIQCWPPLEGFDSSVFAETPLWVVWWWRWKKCHFLLLPRRDEEESQDAFHMRTEQDFWRELRSR